MGDHHCSNGAGIDVLDLEETFHYVDIFRLYVLQTVAKVYLFTLVSMFMSSYFLSTVRYILYTLHCNNI